MNKNKQNILVTGANGQLGHCIQDLAKTEIGLSYQYYYTDVDTLDICDKEQIENFVHTNGIDIIINAAAYTAVDKAEDDIEKAYQLNRDAVRNLAEVAKAHNAYLIHISTDYVFGGDATEPYRTDAAISPKSIYGKSKAAGEQAICDSKCNATLIRTSWLYSEYGHNFVKTMLKLGSERNEISVVKDQVGGPTYAGDLAQAIFKALEININKTGVQTYHYANEGQISWYDFATAIMEMGERKCTVKPISTAEYPAKAPRPAYSVFDLDKIKQELLISIPHWKDSLYLVINKLKEF